MCVHAICDCVCVCMWCKNATIQVHTYLQCTVGRWKVTPRMLQCFGHMICLWPASLIAFVFKIIITHCMLPSLVLVSIDMYSLPHACTVVKDTGLILELTIAVFHLTKSGQNCPMSGQKYLILVKL